MEVGKKTIEVCQCTHKLVAVSDVQFCTSLSATYKLLCLWKIDTHNWSVPARRNCECSKKIFAPLRAPLQCLILGETLRARYHQWVAIIYCLVVDWYICSHLSFFRVWKFCASLCCLPQLRVDKWWGNRKELATVRTICSHVQNMIKGVTLVRTQFSLLLTIAYCTNFCLQY